MFCTANPGRLPALCCSYCSVNCSNISASVVSGVDQCAPKGEKKKKGGKEKHVSKETGLPKSGELPQCHVVITV